MLTIPFDETEHKASAFNQNVVHPVDADATQFKAPVSGYYEVSSSQTRYRTTGKTITVKNTSRKWFQFWKAKYLPEMEFVVDAEMSGKEIVFCNEGDVIPIDARLIQ